MGTSGYFVPSTGPRPAAGPAGSAAGAPPPSTAIAGSSPGLLLDPYLFPPTNATPLFGTDLQPSVNAGTVTLLPGCTLQVPDNNVGVIASITVLLDQIVITSNVVWSILVNGITPPGYNQLRVIPRSGAAAVGVQFVPTRLELPPLAIVTVQAQNIDGGAYNLGAQLYGWYWPAQRY